jgi:hypothetical protein
VFLYQKTEELIEFSEDNIDKKIRTRVSEWIEDIFYVLTFDPSSIKTKRLIKIIENS